MLGLLVASNLADSMPHLELKTASDLSKKVRRKRGKNGMLMTGKLSEPERIAIRKAVASLPDDLLEKGDAKLVIVDTGCTESASGDENDFVPGTLQPMKHGVALEGIGGSLEATHRGMIRYEVVMDSGEVQVLEAPGLFMPKLKCRLFSPQAYAAYRKDKYDDMDWSYTVNWAGSKFVFKGGDVFTICHDAKLKLPMMQCYHNATRTAESVAYMQAGESEFISDGLFPCITAESNTNLSFLQRMKLRWHWKLGHLSFQNLNWIGREGYLGKIGEKLGHSSVPDPVCASCQFGKQK